MSDTADIAVIVGELAKLGLQAYFLWAKSCGMSEKEVKENYNKVKKEFYNRKPSDLPDVS